MITILLKKIVTLLTSISHKDFGASVEDITDDITIDFTKIQEETNRLSVFKYGSVIDVNIRAWRAAQYLSSDGIIATGFPIPKEPVFGVLYDCEHMRIIGFELTQYGELKLTTGWNNGYLGENTFSYIVEELT